MEGDGVVVDLDHARSGTSTPVKAESAFEPLCLFVCSLYVYTTSSAVIGRAIV